MGQALGLALLEDHDDKCCIDISCKIRLIVGIITSVLFVLVGVAGCAIALCKDISDRRNLFLILYTVGSGGSLIASMFFACIPKQFHRIIECVAHLISTIVFVICVTMVYVGVLVIGDPNGPIIAIVFGIIQVGAFVFYSLTLNGFAWKTAKNAMGKIFPCI
jgi:hypothetical protein